MSNVSIKAYAANVNSLIYNSTSNLAVGLQSANNMAGVVRFAQDSYTATSALSIPSGSYLGMLYFTHPIIPIHGFVNGTGFQTGATLDVGWTQTFDFSTASSLNNANIQWFGATIPIASTNAGESPLLGGLASSTGVPGNQFVPFNPINSQAGFPYTGGTTVAQMPILIIVRVNTDAMSTGAVLKLGLFYTDYYL